MPSSVDLASAYADSGVAEVLDQLDRELIGLAPVKTRIREIAALLLVDQARQQVEGAEALSPLSQYHPMFVIQLNARRGEVHDM